VPRLVLISIDGFAAFYWRDPRVKAPTLRRLAARGVVAERMETVFPSTTWPTHVSLVTGVRPATHGVVGNYILNRARGRTEDLTGDPIYDAADLLRAPTLYDRAHAAGRITAAVDWPATRRSASLHFNLPFFKDQRVFETQTDARVWAELGALGFPMDRQGEWAQLPRRFLKDAMVADVATHAWARHQPDLLLVHFLCADSLQHLHGPRSPEAYWAIEYIDGLIGRFLEALPAGALDRDTAVAVVSDHGFLATEREVRVNVHLKRLDVAGDARFVMNHGAGYVYALRDGGAGAALARELAGLEGVARVWQPAEYAALGLPTPETNPHVGDLILDAADGYCFGDATDGELVGASKYLGNHGHLASRPDLGAFFLAAGAGIARGHGLGAITSRDVAPTLARLLDLAPAPSEGRVLADALG
jgi:predicted AlkP superfamily pyrophosphatase or phosphodiesterase